MDDMEEQTVVDSGFFKIGQRQTLVYRVKVKCEVIVWMIIR